MLARIGRGLSEKKQVALLGHELGHKHTRDIHCKRRGANARRGDLLPNQQCSYRGEHDKRFYRVTKKIHKILGTDPAAARAIEAGSGYSPPDGWMKPPPQPRRPRGIHGLMRRAR